MKDHLANEYRTDREKPQDTLTGRAQRLSSVARDQLMMARAIESRIVQPGPAAPAGIAAMKDNVPDHVVFALEDTLATLEALGNVLGRIQNAL